MKIVYNVSTRCFSVIDAIKDFFNPDSKDKTSKQLVPQKNIVVDKNTICENLIESIVRAGTDSITNLPSLYFDAGNMDDYSPIGDAGIAIWNSIPFPCEYSGVKDSDVKKYLDKEDFALFSDAKKFLLDYHKTNSPDKIIKTGKLVFDIDNLDVGFDKDMSDGQKKYAYKQAYLGKEGKSVVVLKNGKSYVIVPMNVLIKEMSSRLKFPKCSMFEVSHVDFLIWCDRNGNKKRKEEEIQKYYALKKQRGLI